MGSQMHPQDQLRDASCHLPNTIEDMGYGQDFFCLRHYEPSDVALFYSSHSKMRLNWDICMLSWLSRTSCLGRHPHFQQCGRGEGVRCQCVHSASRSYTQYDCIGHYESCLLQSWKLVIINRLVPYKFLTVISSSFCYHFNSQTKSTNGKGLWHHYKKLLHIHFWLNCCKHYRNRLRFAKITDTY